MDNSTPGLNTYKKTDELIRICRRAVRQAQQESRDRGVPNVYSINGILHYALPDGTLTTTDPWHGSTEKPS